jgi:hypothetical protein
MHAAPSGCLNFSAAVIHANSTDSSGPLGVLLVCVCTAAAGLQVRSQGALSPTLMRLRPKSVTFAVPLMSSSTFWGFRSLQDKIEDRDRDRSALPTAAVLYTGWHLMPPSLARLYSTSCSVHALKGRPEATLAHPGRHQAFACRL